LASQISGDFDLKEKNMNGKSLISIAFGAILLSSAFPR